MTDPALLAAIDADPACHENLLVLADWLVEREGYELAKGLRWIVRRGRVPEEWPSTRYCWWSIRTSSIPDIRQTSMIPVCVFEIAYDFYPTPSAAYLATAQAAAQALRTCCEELWEPGECCGVCKETESMWMARQGVKGLLKAMKTEGLIE